MPIPLSLITGDRCGQADQGRGWEPSGRGHQRVYQRGRRGDKAEQRRGRQRVSFFVLFCRVGWGGVGGRRATVDGRRKLEEKTLSSFPLFPSLALDF